MIEVEVPSVLDFCIAHIGGFVKSFFSGGLVVTDMMSVKQYYWVVTK
jgi:hypothetical protein